MPDPVNQNAQTAVTPPTDASAPTLVSSRGGSAALGEAPGSFIGQYKLLQVIGEGGFGSVFMAEQERPVQRKVALKIIKLGMDTKQVIARFEAERQALAMMDHPGIAKVFDAGATDNGRPFFVMELCKGTSITEFCDKKKLSIPDRLSLFVDVCQAVQHAHTKGIIHRDIKPSNVLVSEQDSKPLAKVIDFGIAKATVSRLTESTYFTEHRQLIGTPEYMSPEQAEGSLDIDTRTDVYSLGVLLYELLTGTTPLESSTLRSADLSDIPRIIREVEPPRPSTRMTSITTAGERAASGSPSALPPGVIGRGLRGRERAFRRELDWIVMRAMEKDRTRRYDSASEFAADIQRYLKNEPVEAAPPSTAYRVKKFVVRHKVGVSAAALVALALALGVVATSISLYRAVKAEKLAVVEADKAARQAKISDEALKFLVGLFSVVDPSEARGNSVTAREILDKGAARIERELAGQPEARATLMETMGVVYRALGLYKDSEVLLKKALDQRRQLFKEPNLGVAETLSEYATLLVKQGEFDKAEPLYRQALEIYRQTAGEDSTQVAQVLNDLAYDLSQKGEFAAAEPLYRQSLEMRRRLVGSSSKPAADTLHNLAMNLFDQGKSEEAVPLLKDALAIRRSLFGEVHPDVAESLNSLALVLYNRNQLEQATPLFREALEVQKKLVGEIHPDVAMAMNNLAFVLHDSGNLSDAEKTYREVLEIQKKLLGDDHPDIAKVMNNLAAVLHDKGDMEEAERFARESLAMYRRVHGQEHPAIAQGLNNLARWIQEKGDLVEAESMFRDALAMRKKLLGDDHPAVAVTLTGLANLLVDAHRGEEALRAAKDAQAACIKAFPRGHWRIAVADGVVGAALAELKRFDEAEPLLLDSYKSLEGEPGAAIYREDARGRLVILYEAWNRPEQAAPFRTRPNPQAK